MREELPRLTFDFIDYFSKKKLRDKILVELGSGDSTLYWEERFKRVISYEHDAAYFEQVKNKIKKRATELHLYNRSILSDRSFFENIRLADYIIIDNDPRFISRLDFSILVTENKKDSSSIILDNGTWNIEAYDYLRDIFFVKDFPGINKVNANTVTSIFSVVKSSNYFL